MKNLIYYILKIGFLSIVIMILTNSQRNKIVYQLGFIFIYKYCFVMICDCLSLKLNKTIM